MLLGASDPIWRSQAALQQASDPISSGERSDLSDLSPSLSPSISDLTLNPRLTLHLRSLVIFLMVNLLHIIFKKIVALYTLFLYLQELSILFCLSLICCSTECSGLVLLNIYSRNAVNEYVLDVFDRMPERKYQLLKTSNML